MTEKLPTGVYALASFVMLAALVCDFIWVIGTALGAMQH